MSKTATAILKVLLIIGSCCALSYATIIVVGILLGGNRPTNLTGTVTCDLVDDGDRKSQKVIVILDEVAVNNRSDLKITIATPAPLTPGWIGTTLEADFGAADGSSHGCGSVNGKLIQIKVTGQMISYPSELYLITDEPVEVQITDTQGHWLSESQIIKPGQDPMKIKWLK